MMSAAANDKWWIKGLNTHKKRPSEYIYCRKLELRVQQIACVSTCSHLSFVYIVYNYFMQRI